MAVSIQQAAIKAVIAFLRPLMPDVEFDSYFLTADQELPEKAVTIMAAGNRIDEPTLDIREMVDSRDLIPPSATRKVFTWRVKACRQPLQLDVWANSEVARDDIIARLDENLNKGVGETLGIVNADPVRDGLLVALSDGWSGYADVIFDNVSLTDTPTGAARDEWRATMNGEASMMLTVEAESPTIVAVKLRALLTESTTPTTDTYTITATGFSQSSP